TAGRLRGSTASEGGVGGRADHGGREADRDGVALRGRRGDGHDGREADLGRRRLADDERDSDDEDAEGEEEGRGGERKRPPHPSFERRDHAIVTHATIISPAPVAGITRTGGVIAP